MSFREVDRIQDVSLDAGGSTQKDLFWEIDPNMETGEYTVQVESLDDTDSIIVKVGGFTITEDTTYLGIPRSEADSKLRNRWVFGTLTDGTAEDAVGSADGSVNGVSSASGDWIYEYAGSGDGSSAYIDTTTLGTFGSSMDSSDFAVGFSMSSTVSTTGSDSLFVGGVRNTADGGSTDFLLELNRTTDGEVALHITDSSNNDLIVESSGGGLTDGNPHRVIINKTSNTASGIEFWVDGSSISSSTIADQGFSGPGDFSYNFQMFAANNAGSPTGYYPGYLDDFCIFDNSLTQTEIESYINPWGQ